MIHSTAHIHSSAIVDTDVRIGAGCRVGPYCTIEGNVTLEENVSLHSHVCIAGRTLVGARTRIFPFAALGYAPQDLKYKGEASELVIGYDNVIREYVTFHPGTAGDRMETRIGNHGLFMIGVHVAHDCIVGDHAVLSNNATLAGHVSLGNHVIIGGLSAVHQFVHIGDYAMIGGMCGVTKDVIPYGIMMRENDGLGGLNLTGLKRNGFTRHHIQSLLSVYKTIFEENLNRPISERIESVSSDLREDPIVGKLISFIEHNQRPLCMPKSA